MENQIEFLSCVKCKSNLQKKDDLILCSNNECDYSVRPFSSIDGKLVLVDFDNSIVHLDFIKNTNASSLVKRTENFNIFLNWGKQILNGRSEVSKLNIKTCLDLLSVLENPRILVIGGGTIGAGCELIYIKYPKSVISFDIYNSDNVDFIADAHSIPLRDQSVDFIVVQAVLEHVVSPLNVVDECFRVLKLGGYIYAETPFLQAVHEGAYDFTRFTVLGHRMLFKKFIKIRSGFNGGLGQSLLWSIEYFARGIFRSRFAGKIVKSCFFWLRWLEASIPNSYNQDGACGSYFIGKKPFDKLNASSSDLLKDYEGAQ